MSGRPIYIVMSCRTMFLGDPDHGLGRKDLIMAKHKHLTQHERALIKIKLEAESHIQHLYVDDSPLIIGRGTAVLSVNTVSSKPSASK